MKFDIFREACNSMNVSRSLFVTINHTFEGFIMRTYVLAIFFALFSSLSFSQGNQTTVVNVSNLTPEQQKAVQAVANQMAEKKSDAPAILQAIQNIDSTKVRGWAEAGTEAGKAVGNFAREIGVVAQTFLDSFVGKATFILVFMNYGGGKLAQFMFNVFAFIALTPLFSFFVWKVFKRFVLQVTTTTEKKLHANPFYRLIRFNEVTSKTEKIEYDDKDYRFWSPIVGWIFIVVSSFVYFGFMWPRW